MRIWWLYAYVSIYVCLLVSIPLLLGTFLVSYHIDAGWALSFTYEDGLIQQSTMICLFIASIVAFVLARRIRQRSRPHYLFFLALGVAFAVFGLEEISWGQRIMGIDSPEFFLRNNDQEEINIHNTLQKWYKVRTRQVAAWCLLAYGIIVPLLAFIRRRGRGEVLSRPCAVPPAGLAGPFAIVCYLLYYDPFAGQGEELGEFFGSLCLLCFVVLEWIKLQAFQPESP